MFRVSPEASTTGDAVVKLAVLIDADNAQAAMVGLLLAEVAKYGTASVKRAYGDWTQTNLKGWKDQLLRQSIQPMQQFAYTQGKNATDSAMIIDAMDLLYTQRFGGFCIVSSDSDFTRLAQRIRESGLVVYGFGERKTPEPFVAACDKFIYSENLAAGSAAAAAAVATAAVAAAAAAVATAAAAAGVPPLRGHEMLSLPMQTGGESDGAAVVRTAEQQQLLAAVAERLLAAVRAVAEDDGWSSLAMVGSLVLKQHPDFDPRTYGHAKLSELVQATAMFKMVRRVPHEGKPAVIYVREHGRAAITYPV